jgi:hypothetical protein
MWLPRALPVLHDRPTTIARLLPSSSRTRWFSTLSVSGASSGLPLGERQAIASFPEGDVVPSSTVSVPGPLPQVSGDTLRGSSFGPGDYRGKVIVLAAVYLSIVIGVIYMSKGQRRIPMQQAKQMRTVQVRHWSVTARPLRTQHSCRHPCRTQRHTWRARVA